MYAELKEACEQVGSAECYNETFSVSTDPKRFDPVDVVLLSHCLYGQSAKLSLLDHALRFLKTNGVLLVVHRWKGETLEAIAEHLISQDFLVRKKAWDTVISLNEATPSDRECIAAYTKMKAITSSSRPNSVAHTVGSVAIEKDCFLNADRKKSELATTRARVGFLAKQKVPFAVIRPHTPTGIAAAVQSVARREIRCSGISCVGGGHSANCLGQDALAIDLSLMNDIFVDVGNMCVTVGAGAVIGKITRACEEHGLLVPLGDRPGVGIGLILQGGLNHFMRLYGLASDGIQSVKFIDPAGETTYAETPDQLFPFQGAGTNFGVVLAVTLKCHPLLSIHTQSVLYDQPTFLSNLVSKYSQKAVILPREQSLDGFLFWTSSTGLSFATSQFTICEQNLPGPDGALLLVDQGFNGRVISSASNLKPSDLYDRELYMTDLFSASRVLEEDDEIPQKLRSLKLCLFFDMLSHELSDELCKLMVLAPTKWCYIHFLHGISGESRIREPIGAFGQRGWNFAAVITGRWPDGSSLPTVIQWIEDCKKVLLRRSRGVYSADLGPTDIDLAPHAFGKTFLQLNRSKRYMDPLNLFRHGCPLHTSLEVRDPRNTNRRTIIAICGRRCSGKDWLADKVSTVLRTLCGNIAEKIALSSISNSVKSMYANASGDEVDLQRLHNDRRYKEEQRQRLSDFYGNQKKRELYFDERCLLQCIDGAPEARNTHSNRATQWP